MTHRTLIVIFALAFVSLPLMCTAGIAAHECECGDNTCCESKEESQCDADPCESMTTARVETDDHSPANPVMDAAPDSVPFEFAPADYSPVVAVSASRRLPSAAIIHPIRI